MKKTISLLLAFVLCLSLCACGGQQPIEGKGYDSPEPTLPTSDPSLHTSGGQQTTEGKDNDSSETTLTTYDPSLYSSGRQQTIEGKGYDSPEAALTAYAKALKTGNVPRILSTYAMETYVEHFDVAAYWTHIGVVMPTGKAFFDSIDSYTSGINLVNRQHEITEHLTNLYITIATGKDPAVYKSSFPLNGEPYDNAGEFLDEVMMDNWMVTLSKMEFDGTFTYLEDVVHNADTMDKAREQLRNQCGFYGCEEIVSLALEIKLDGEIYLLCMDTACYDGKWYNLLPVGQVGLFLSAPTNCGGICETE